MTFWVGGKNCNNLEAKLLVMMCLEVVVVEIGKLIAVYCVIVKYFQSLFMTSYIILNCYGFDYLK